MNVDINLKILSFNRRFTLSKQGLQYGIGIFTVIVATVVAYWGSLPILVLFLAAMGMILTTLVFMRHIAVGYFLLLVGGMFIPFSGPGGINAAMIILIFMAFLWLMNMLVVQRRFEFVRSGPIRPAVYFMLMSVVAFGMGQISWFVFAKQAPLDTQLGGFAIYFFSFVALVMTANVLKDDRWLKAFVWLFIGLGAAYMVGRAAEFSFIDVIYQRGYIANSMFWTWMVAVALGQVIFNHELSRRARAALFLVVALTLYIAVVLGNDWKSGWVPPLIAAGVLLALRFKKLAIVAIPFALVAAKYLSQDLISSDQYSWGTRVDAWLVVLDISRISPIFGLGFANYYWFAKVFNIRGYHIQFSSHSQYVDIIAQTGLVGLVCFFWAAFEVTRLAWNLSQRAKDGFGRGYAHGVLAGLMGSLVAGFLVDWILPFAYNIGLQGFRASILPWIFFGGLISLEQIHLKEETS